MYVCSICSATRGCCGWWIFLCSPQTQQLALWKRQQEKNIHILVHILQWHSNISPVIALCDSFNCFFLFLTELPGPPTNMAISNIGPRSINLQFKPGYDGKTSISRWLVEAQVSQILTGTNTFFLFSYLKSSVKIHYVPQFLRKRGAVFDSSVVLFPGGYSRRKWGLVDGPPGVQRTRGSLLRGARSQPIYLLQVMTGNLFLWTYTVYLSVAGLRQAPNLMHLRDKVYRFLFPNY